MQRNASHMVRGGNRPLTHFNRSSKMKVDVYDTYAKNSSGGMIHFDVLVSEGTDASTAFNFAQEWLSEIGVPSEALSQNRCMFCHTEMASDEVAQAIVQKGYYILQMEGCPNPR